jgi:hypothetical protein
MQKPLCERKRAALILIVISNAVRNLNTCSFNYRALHYSTVLSENGMKAQKISPLWSR